MKTGENMKNKIILHQPHSSTKIPYFYLKKKKVLSSDKLKKFNLAMCDLYTDKLFAFHGCKKVKFRLSRIVCDVEKFVDDDMEVMTKYGMGVVCTKTNMGENIFSPDEKYKDFILKKYYYKHHTKLDKVVTKYLKNSRTIIIDCHSFSKEIIMDENLKDELPDICIGFNNGIYYSEKLVDFTSAHFRKYGYSVKLNYPYSGTIIPNKFMKEKSKNLYSIMIEINRKIYLDKYKKSSNYKHLRKTIKNYLKQVKTIEDL